MNVSNKVALSTRAHSDLWQITGGLSYIKAAGCEMSNEEVLFLFFTTALMATSSLAPWLHHHPSVDHLPLPPASVVTSTTHSLCWPTGIDPAALTSPCIDLHPHQPNSQVRADRICHLLIMASISHIPSLVPSLCLWAQSMWWHVLAHLLYVEKHSEMII